ncbi:MAG: MGMT family protein [bacterium]|nr:MAG: MGMT family protein [bacterium]
MSRGKNNYSIIIEVVRKIPRGKVATYGQIARLAGLPGQARQVGYALHRLPSHSDVPWQRVINSQGRISFPPDSVAWNMQKSILHSEGIHFDRNETVSLAKYQWKPR